MAERAEAIGGWCPNDRERNSIEPSALWELVSAIWTAIAGMRLSYSDDGRLDLMLDILHGAAERMQVIILTCRDRAFRHMNENRLLLTASNG